MVVLKRIKMAFKKLTLLFYLGIAKVLFLKKLENWICKELIKIEVKNYGGDRNG